MNENACDFDAPGYILPEYMLKTLAFDLIHMSEYMFFGNDNMFN